METREIVARNGETILVDADDFRFLKWFTWSIRDGYAVCAMQLMHRIVLDAPGDRLVDHKNRNRLDNRKSNLRLATHAQNNCNVIVVEQRRGESKFRGVSRCIRKNKRKITARQWRAVIRSENRKFSLGYFETELDAAKAYDEAAIKFHGEFAVLNFPKDDK